MAYDVSEWELPPVTDWVNDWDWLDPQWGPNAIDIWNGVREVCPVATTERYGRAFMPVTYDAVAQGGSGHRALLVDLGERGPSRFPATAGATDHVGPTGPPRSSPSAAAVVQPQGGGSDWKPTCASSVVA